MIKEEISNQVLKYFNYDSLAANVWIDKYALKNEKGEILESTPDDMHRRIAKEIARIESNYPNPLSEQDIYDVLKDFKYIIPQGSPMFGIGNNYQIVSLSNCFVIGDNKAADSYGSIMKTDQEQVQLMKRRAGVGHDLSHIRPKGSPVLNSALTSTGIVPFMERYSNSTKEVAQGGRRGALMLSISINHPDSEDFIDAKLKEGKVTGANISVKCTDYFMQCVKNDTDFIHSFPIDLDISLFEKEIEGLEYKKTIKVDGGFIRKTKAKELWTKIVHNAWKSAEPGVLFWDTIIRESVPDCYAEEGYKTISTNPSLRGDTLVLTKEGVFSIKELDGKDITIRNILGSWEPAQAFLSGENKYLWEIEFTNTQKIYATAEHKHPVLNISGNIINMQTGKVIKKRTDELKRRDKFYLPEFSESPINVDFKFDYSDGFTCGWITGDGWVSWHKTQETFLYGFVFSEEDKNNQIFNMVLEKINSKLERKVNLRENKGCYEFSSSSKDIDSYFREEIGLTHKSNGIPDYIWKSNDKFIKGYIDGLFSSDGYVDEKQNRIILTSKYEKLLIDIQNLLGFYGIRSNINKTNFKCNFSIDKIYTRFDLHISTKHAQKFANIFKLSHNKKAEKLLNILNKEIIGKFANDRNYLVVKSVTKTDIKENVYDITVFDNTHTFQISACITGNCGELPLCSKDSCRLLALNLYSYVKNPFTHQAKFNFDLFKKHAAIAQRMMDDIVDLELEKIDSIIAKINADPEDINVKIVELNLWKEIRVKAKEGRRTGVGITAEGDMLAALGLIYGTENSNDFAIEVQKTLAVECYKSSIVMAKERGCFSVWDLDKEKNNLFIKRILENLSPDYLLLYQKYGRRNIANLTIAPTGTVSLLTQTTSGIEPCFMPIYKRRKRTTDKSKSVFTDESGEMFEEFNVFHHKFITWLEANGYNYDEVKNYSMEQLNTLVEKSPYYKATANDVDWVSKVKMQGGIQKWVDHSISCTVNVPKETSEDVIDSIYKEAYNSGCKGVTIYREGSRSGILISGDTKSNQKFEYLDSIKRPEHLECDIYHKTVQKRDLTIVVGLLEGKPFEMFWFDRVNNYDFPLTIKKGTVTKVKSKTYKLTATVNNKTYEIPNIISLINENEQTQTRDYSLMLRHRINPLFIIQSIQSYATITSFEKVVERVLKMYVKDGQKTKDMCPNCSAKLVFQSGCPICPECGWTAC